MEFIAFDFNTVEVGEIRLNMQLCATLDVSIIRNG